MRIFGVEIKRVGKEVSPEQKAENERRLAEIIKNEEPAPQEWIDKWNAKEKKKEEPSKEAVALRERLSTLLNETKSEAKFWTGMNQPFGSEEVGRLVEITYAEPLNDINEKVKGLKGIDRQKAIVALKDQNREIKKAGRLLTEIGILKGECEFKETTLIINGKEKVFRRVYQMRPLEEPISKEEHAIILGELKIDDAFRKASSKVSKILVEATGRKSEEIDAIVEPLMMAIHEDIQTHQETAV